MQVNVYDISDPSTVTHTGSLTLTVTYLGRYQVTVPAGTYPAALIKWQYNGQVGPATVSDVEYRFFADGVGPVAAIDKQSVSAFLVYNKDTKFGKVLICQGPVGSTPTALSSSSRWRRRLFAAGPVRFYGTIDDCSRRHALVWLLRRPR